MSVYGWGLRRGPGVVGVGLIFLLRGFLALNKNRIESSPVLSLLSPASTRTPQPRLDMRVMQSFCFLGWGVEEQS